MVKENNAIVINGIVEEALPNAFFKVRIQDNLLVLASVSGKMRTFYIRLIPGDKVAVEISPYDLTRGRIVTRYRN